MTSSIRKRFARLLVVGAAVGAFAAAAPAAQAGPLVASAPSCDSQQLEQPFTPWLDLATYTLDNGGTFEPGDGSWALAGASVVDGNEPWQVRGDGGTHSLRIPSGSSATSSTICVGLEHPTVRFFARNTGSLLGTLNVDVLFEDSFGNVRSLRIGSVAGGSSWQPTLTYPIIANLLPLLPGDYTPVAFKLSAAGGDWRVDDFYVDPHSK